MKHTSKPIAYWSRYVGGLLPPAALFALTIGILIYSAQNRLHGELEFEENILREWVLETRIGQSTLVELVRQFRSSAGPDREDKLDAIRTHLAVLGDVIRTNQGLLPLFPFLYRMELRLGAGGSDTVLWESNLPVPRGLEPMEIKLAADAYSPATLVLHLQLRAFANRQEEIARKQARFRYGLSLIAIAAAGVALLWVTLFLRRERAIELKEYRAREQLDTLERQRLQEQLRREEEELKRQEAERQVLEARTKLYADISVLAGSYAHNIKNLLVRPNDLLHRCLETDVPREQEQRMLREARESLRHVAERTHQILRTVRRDLEPASPKRIDLNTIVSSLGNQWRELASHQWNVDLRIQTDAAPIWVNGDASHLQQALENLLCNARDATFEQRNRLRELARSNGQADASRRQLAILDAAAWQGIVTVKALSGEAGAVLSVQDNGIGMTEAVLKRCTEAHFTTKRDNAMHEGRATGMGLGLSFVSWVVEQHAGKLIVDSREYEGTTVKMVLPFANSEIGS